MQNVSGMHLQGFFMESSGGNGRILSLGPQAAARNKACFDICQHVLLVPITSTG